MNNFFVNTEENRDFDGFDALTSNEMLKVRGGGDTKPDTRQKDFFEFDED